MKNLGNNRISASLTPEDFSAVKQAIQEIGYRMPFLLGLTIEERRKLAKMSRSNKLFVADALDVARENPTVLPYYLTFEELEKDYVLFQQLNEILLPLEQLYERVRDTQIMAGSEAYQTSLTLYKLTKVAADAGMPGMDSAHAKLKVRFEGQGSQGSTEAEMEDTPASNVSSSDVNAIV
ncbi:MAG TPA: hypothetical protein PKC76_05985 [Saprospiraceae bacterium]|nr:hypothetical protein [Saprospiraceae bacterium]HMP23660.1 hypothetical protein [Saprospiraceae bacterium]